MLHLPSTSNITCHHHRILSFGTASAPTLAHSHSHSHIPNRTSTQLTHLLQRSPTLVTIFTHHLLIDAILSTIPRVLLIPAIASIPGTLCAEVEYQRSQLSPRDARALFGFWTADRCRAGLWAAQAVVALLALAMTAVQWWCAWRVRGYARWLEEGDRREREGDVEKRGWGEEKDKGEMRSGERV